MCQAVRWLAKFLDVRRADLANAYNPETRSVWRESVGRAEFLAALAGSGDYSLTKPIQLSSDEHFVVALMPNVANLKLLSGNEFSYDTDIAGNAGNNTLTGNFRDNVLDGKAGNDRLIGREGSDQLVGSEGRDEFTGGAGNDWLDLGYNKAKDNAEDTIIYTNGDGKDTVAFFQRTGNKRDLLLFQDVEAIDVVVKQNRTEFRLSDGISNNSRFGQGRLLMSLDAVKGFTPKNIIENLTAENVTQFLFR